MILPVYPPLNVIFFKFSIIHKTFFARVCFQWYTFPGETSAEKSDDLKWQKLYTVKLATTLFLYTVLSLVFMYKGSQPRIYADLLRFQSRVKDPILIIV